MRRESKQDRDLRAYRSLLAGGSLEQAAATAGVSLRTLYRRRVIARFQAYLERTARKSEHASTNP